MFYDSQGDAMITDGKQVILTYQNVCLKSYDVKKVKKSDGNYFKYHKGHRMDYKNHNWILFNEFISLSKSFYSSAYSSTLPQKYESLKMKLEKITFFFCKIMEISS